MNQPIISNSVEGAIDALKSTALYQYLESLDTALAANCVSFVQHVTPLLDEIRTFFPYYTNHSANVIRRIEQITYPECLIADTQKTLSKVDAFLLIVAAYGHDLGMTILPGEETTILQQLGLNKTQDWQTNKDLQKFLRESHSSRGGKYIAQHYKEIGIPVHLLGFISLLNESHNYSIDQLQKELGPRHSADSKEINLLQLASILCTADLLEFSEARVIDGVIELLEEEIKASDDPDLRISLQENLKHAFIHANLTIGSDGMLVMSGTFPDPEVLNATYKTVDFIEKWVHIYCDFDIAATVRRLRIRNDSVVTTFNIPDREFERLGIRMNKQNVISLIASNSIWINKPEIAIRELLQNAVEACRFRKHHSREFENYKPIIKLSLDKNAKTITITDNGCGMSKHVILNNLLTVGNSRSKEPNYRQGNYASLARFGIGFWSVFTIAKKACVSTVEYLPGLSMETTQTGTTFEVSINLLKDYIVFEKYQASPGTAISLELLNNINLNELINKIIGPNGIIMCSEIPIEIDYWGNRMTVGPTPKLPSLQDLFGPKIGMANDDGTQIYTHRETFGDISLDVFMLYRKSGEKISFVHSSGEGLDIPFHIRFEHKCICGFKVNTYDNFPIHELISTGGFGYIANKTDPSGFQYNINRQSLLKTPEVDEYFSKVNNTLISVYRKLLRTYDCDNPKDIVRLFEEGQHSHRNTGIDTMRHFDQVLKVAPDLLCYNLYKIDPSVKFNQSEMKTLSIQEMMREDYLIITAWHFFSIHNGYRRRVEFQHAHLYDLIKDHLTTDQQAFYSKRNDGDLLFANDPNSAVVFIKIQTPPLGHTYVTLMITKTNSLQVNCPKDWIIGMIQGTWTGNIVEKKIIGGEFAFVNQLCFLQPGSKLAGHVRALYNDGMIPDICSLMTKLELSLFGYRDPSLDEWL
ncbi:MAG: hypothetical protein DI535_00690 [Citrobacter freundii]|nr:MAG: hypothetical protein DI535_00690 [Citrobacter freundii]